jgi:hypothetical protein
MDSWNDRALSALEGRPGRGDGLVVVAGNTNGTVSIPLNAFVHTIYLEGHSGDASLTFPNGNLLDVKNGQQATFDFHGFLPGGDFVIGGSGGHYLFTYLPAR